jgi:hypothetical protein
VIIAISSEGNGQSGFVKVGLREGALHPFRFLPQACGYPRPGFSGKQFFYSGLR